MVQFKKKSQQSVIQSLLIVTKPPDRLPNFLTMQFEMGTKHYYGVGGGWWAQTIKLKGYSSTDTLTNFFSKMQHIYTVIFDNFFCPNLTTSAYPIPSGFLVPPIQKNRPVFERRKQWKDLHVGQLQPNTSQYILKFNTVLTLNHIQFQKA